MNYGINLEKLRERLGLSQRQVGDILNIDKSLYRRYEKELQTIPISHLNVLCNYYDVSLDYIFGFSDEKKYNKSKLEINNDLSGERIKALRKEKKLTQDKISDVLGILRQTISNYERGKSIIATPFLYSICKDYGVSADYLLGKIDVMCPKNLKIGNKE